MFENEAKGWFGSYSVAGRSSAQKYHVIKQKDEILAGVRKRIILKDIFTPDDPAPLECLEDNIDVFKVYSNDHKDKMNFIPKSQRVQKLPEEKVDKFKYHNQHMKERNKRKKQSQPALTRYHPHYEYIWSRTITGPQWKILKGRSTKPLPIDEKDFYI